MIFSVHCCKHQVYSECNKKANINQDYYGGIHMEYITLNTGAKMPLEGFGAMMFDPSEAGKAEGIVKREELFVVSKLWVQDMTDEAAAAKAIETSLANLGLDYIDLYLLHQAMGDYFAAYRAMESAYKAGKLKAIGVANFFPNILCNFCETVEVTPAVNQVELNPFFTQEDALANMKNYGVQPMAWSPLAEGKNGIFTDPEMTEIGKKYGKTAAQVALRWNTQRGVVIIPKSSNPDRMAQNLDIWDFSLSEDEMKVISAKDLGHSEIINHFDPEIVKMILGMKIHQ